MPLRGIRLQGQTYVRVDDVVNMLRKSALKYVTTLPGNNYASATAAGIGSEATRIENAFKDWSNKADHVEFKNR